MIAFWGTISVLGLFCLIIIAVLGARNGWLRVGIAGISLLVYFTLGLGLLTQLGGPMPYKPVLGVKLTSLAGLNLNEDCVILAYTFVENEAIYIWLQVPGQPIPVYLALPWSEGQAKEMIEADAQARMFKKGGLGTGRLMMKRQKTENQEDTWVLHPEPVPEYPPKIGNE